MSKSLVLVGAGRPAFRVLNARFRLLLPVVACCACAIGAGCSSSSYGDRASLNAAATQPTATDATASPRASHANARGDSALPPARPANDVANHERESVTVAFAYPTGDRDTSVVLLEKTFPAQTRLGKAYQYDLRVTNLTDVALTGVTIRERVPEAPRLPDTFPGAAVDAAPAPTTGPATQEAPASQQPAAPQTQPSDRAGNLREFPIGHLAPHQSKSVSVTGVASHLGNLDTLTSVAYTPLLGAGVEVINPILKLTKEAPRQADLCEQIPYHYVVANVGTGTETNVRIEEKLPDGLHTVDGKDTVVLDVGDLPQGRGREFTVQLKAARTGAYGGRAVARGAGTEAQSAEVDTIVRAPKLAVAVTGPDSEYVGKAAGYDLVVSNVGDAPARETLVTASADTSAPLVFFAGIRPDAPEPRVGEHDVEPRPNTQNLGTIEPGQSKKARVAFRPAKGGPMNVSVSARATCAEQVSSAARTTVLTAPALSLEVKAREDLVRVGEDALYTIHVSNSGSGDDHNVRIVTTLPAQLTLVKADGPTEAKVDGQRLVFGALPSLAPGQSATWTVQGRAANPGDVRFRVELTSESLTEPTLETAATKLY